MKEKILKALKEGNSRLYDIVASDYYQMSKDELKDLCLEIYAVLVDKCSIEEAHKEIRDNLKEWRGWE